MPIPTPLLTHTTRTVAILRPRQSGNNNNNNGLDVGSILGCVFGGLAVLVAVILGILQIRRWNKEDRRLADKWYKKLGRMLTFWRRA